MRRERRGRRGRRGSGNLITILLLFQRADSGLYECQISSTPVMSHIVSLRVTQPRTLILGGENVFVEEGDTMNLTCLVKESINPL